MAIKVSDLSNELKREILSQLHDQLGDTQYQFIKEKIGEDGMIALFLESAEKAGHQSKNYSASISKPDRRPLLLQVLLWTLVIGSFFGYGIPVFLILIPLYGLLKEWIRKQNEFMINSIPPYYRSKTDSHVKDKDDSDGIYYFAALVCIIINWIFIGKFQLEFILGYISFLIIIFILNLFGHTLYRIIKDRDKTLLIRAIVITFLLLFVIGLFWLFLPETISAVVSFFSGMSHVFLGTGQTGN